MSRREECPSGVHDATNSKRASFCVFWKLHDSAHAWAFYAGCLWEGERLVPYAMGRCVREYPRLHRLGIEPVSGRELNYHRSDGEPHQELFVRWPVLFKDQRRPGGIEELPKVADHDRVLPAATAEAKVGWHLTITRNQGE